MDILKSIAGAVWMVFITLVLLFIGLIPNFVFQVQGWAENPDLDLLSRIIGFIIVVFLITWYCNRKK